MAARQPAVSAQPDLEAGVSGFVVPPPGEPEPEPQAAAEPVADTGAAATDAPVAVADDRTPSSDNATDEATAETTGDLA
jgi:hypothetical protein